jgi:tetratricopeptide (TPR) repeat protein
MAAQARRDFEAEMSRAESLYHAAEFGESLTVLGELENSIGDDPKRTADLLKVKLFTGLAYLGLNLTDKAKSSFIDVCKLDNEYSLNPQDYPVQAIRVYYEAKANCAAATTGTLSSNASVIESTFSTGRELYNRGQFGDALKYFNAVLVLDATHVLAREYLNLAQQRLAILSDRSYMEWRQAFDARQFDRAAEMYKEILADQQLRSGTVVTRIEGEYQKAFADQISAWKLACAKRELDKLDSIWNESVNLASGLPLGRDAVDRLQPCPIGVNIRFVGNTIVVPAEPAFAAHNPAELTSEAKSVPQKSGPLPEPPPGPCVQSEPLLAMARLKTRVNPQIDPALQRYIGRGIAVRVQIDEQGNVEVKDVAKANPKIAEALRSAIEQWKFHPTVIRDEVRCVETELPLTVITP